MDSKIAKEQGLPLGLTIVTFFLISILYFFSIQILNTFPSTEKIVPQIHIADVLVGLTVYFKVSIDFAIFMGNLMRTNPGWKKRIAIEAGTAFGNAAGTILILFIWNFFREVPLLMAAMIIIASLVLLRMSQESFETFLGKIAPNHKFHKPVLFIEEQLDFINNRFKPFLGKLIPEFTITNTRPKPFLGLLLFSLTIPFILGLDDFAGYIPLFSVINVFGFGVGVFLGHMLLNIGLFLSPETTTKLTQTSIVLVVGGGAFILIAAWGIYEALNLIFMAF